MLYKEERTMIHFPWHPYFSPLDDHNHSSNGSTDYIKVTHNSNILFTFGNVIVVAFSRLLFLRNAELFFYCLFKDLALIAFFRFFIDLRAFG